ncbi:MAG: response regulator, partial [Pseudomonadota bacterium]
PNDVAERTPVGLQIKAEPLARQGSWDDLTLVTISVVSARAETGAKGETSPIRAANDTDPQPTPGRLAHALLDDLFMGNAPTLSGKARAGTSHQDDQPALLALGQASAGLTGHAMPAGLDYIPEAKRHGSQPHVQLDRINAPGTALEAVGVNGAGTWATAEQNTGAFGMLFDGAPLAMALVDVDGAIVRANTAFTKLIAESGEQAPSDTTSSAPTPTHPATSIAQLLSPASFTEITAALHQTLAAEPEHTGPEHTNPEHSNRGAAPETHDVTFNAVRPGGPGEPDVRCSGQFLVNAAPAWAHTGGRKQALIYAVDTTEHRALEARYAQSQKMQAVGQLAGGMAHDFNNVLTTITLSSDFLLQSHRPSDPAFRDINAIKQNAMKAASIVRQLLAFSRQQTLIPQVLNLTEVISDWSIWLSSILDETIELDVSHGRDLWPIHADKTQFEQIIMNLAVNARDAMPEGGRLAIRTYNLGQDKLRAQISEALPAGDYVVCEVSDTGTGMPQEVVAKIFEPFFSTKEVGKGTGLGLSMVYGIIKQTGGFIFCDSAEGIGTTFRIYLPRFAGKVVEAEPARTQARAPSGAQLDDPTGTGTILLVEDEEPVRKFAARALVRQGYSVLEAGSGREALDVMAQTSAQIDLVVSDIVMPEMNGPTLLKNLRRTQPDLKIVFISGYAEDHLKTLTADDEFTYLPKPFQLKDLVWTVKQAMAKDGSGSVSASTGKRPRTSGLLNASDKLKNK